MMLIAVCIGMALYTHEVFWKLDIKNAVFSDIGSLICWHFAIFHAVLRHSSTIAANC